MIEILGLFDDGDLLKFGPSTRPEQSPYNFQKNETDGLVKWAKRFGISFLIGSGLTVIGKSMEAQAKLPKTVTTRLKRAGVGLMAAGGTGLVACGLSALKSDDRGDVNSEYE